MERRSVGGGGEEARRIASSHGPSSFTSEQDSGLFPGSPPLLSSRLDSLPIQRLGPPGLAGRRYETPHTPEGGIKRGPWSPCCGDSGVPARHGSARDVRPSTGTYESEKRRRRNAPPKRGGGAAERARSPDEGRSIPANEEPDGAKRRRPARRAGHRRNAAAAEEAKGIT